MNVRVSIRIFAASAFSGVIACAILVLAGWKTRLLRVALELESSKTVRTVERDISVGVFACTTYARHSTITLTSRRTIDVTLSCIFIVAIACIAIVATKSVVEIGVVAFCACTGVVANASTWAIDITYLLVLIVVITYLADLAAEIHIHIDVVTFAALTAVVTNTAVRTG